MNILEAIDATERYTENVARRLGWEEGHYLFITNDDAVMRFSGAFPSPLTKTDLKAIDWVVVLRSSIKNA